MIDHATLTRLLDYDPHTGSFKWKHRPGRRGGARTGAVAGWPHRLGYWCITVFDSQYYAHRLAWLHVNAEWPPSELDHIDNDKRNNAIANLRLATRAQNNANRGKMGNNKSGYKGVSWINAHGKWRAACRARGKTHHLGYFTTREAAYEAYLRGSRRLHGEFARG